MKNHYIWANFYEFLVKILRLFFKKLLYLIFFLFKFIKALISIINSQKLKTTKKLKTWKTWLLKDFKGERIKLLT